MAGSAMVLPECRWMWNGVEGADSLVVNPHKWLGAAFDCTLYYVRDPEHLVRVMSTNPSFLQTAADGRVKNLRDWGIPLGRRFRALKLWFLIREQGVSGLQARLRRDLENARWLADEIARRRRMDACSRRSRCRRSACGTSRPGSSGDALDRHTQAWADRVNRSGARLSDAGGPRRPMDGARVDRRGTDRALARRGAVDDDADGGRTMTMTNADSYASVAARERHVPRGLANTHAIFVDRAEGTRVWDVDGKEYLDFTSGIGVLNTGHRHPHVVRAVQEQLDRLMHTCFQVTMYEPYVELAARLCALVGDATHKAVLFTTGAEGDRERRQDRARVHEAIRRRRVQRRVPRTLAARADDDGVEPRLPAELRPVRGRRLPRAVSRTSTTAGRPTGRSTRSSELFSTEVMPEQVAAVVIEPELGEGGFIPAPAAFLQRLRAITAAPRHRARRRRGAERLRTDRQDVRLSARRRSSPIWW